MRSEHQNIARPLACLAALLTLSGCVAAEPVRDGRYEPDRSGRYAEPLAGSPVIANETPYSEALRCMAPYAMRRPMRIAVGDIADDTGSRVITQGGSLMAMSALAKAGVPLVERFDTAVAELERKYAGSNRSGGASTPGAYRAAFGGSVPGSDYYLVGGITELNFNIASERPAPGSASYVMNVGLDLRLVDSNTLEVADAVSYQKQIGGYREHSGALEFLGHRFTGPVTGESAQEPIQLAVRSLIERAVLEMVSRLYRAPTHSCASGIGTAADPLAGPDDRIVTASARTTSAESIASDQMQQSHQAASRRFHRTPRFTTAPHLRRSLD